MENLTSEKLAKSRCFPVRILLINHIRVIIILTFTDQLKNSVKPLSPRSQSVLYPAVEKNKTGWIACLLARNPREENILRLWEPVFAAKCKVKNN